MRRIRPGVSIAAFLAAVFLALPALAVLAGGNAETEELKAEVAAVKSELAGVKARTEEAWVRVSRSEFGEACAACHGSTPKFPVLGAKLGYDTSGHKNNGNSYYANGGGCQRCHTNEGFIEYATKGAVDPKAFVRYPSQQGCFSCHAPHERGDFSLRIQTPVKLGTGVTADFGKGNLCANCHQVALGTAKQVVKASEAKSVFAFFGAHHGPQADAVAGTNAWEFAGKAYSSSAHKDVVQDGCVACHMSLPEGRYGFSPGLGGHSFNVSADVHEVGKVNNSGCLSCHPDLKQVAGAEIFDLKAKADYDRDGTIEPVQLEVQGLLDAFVNKKGTGALQTMEPPMFKKDAEATFAGLGAGWANSRTGQWSEAQLGALYNYKFFVEDRSRGVHNATYTLQVLYDSLKALNSSFDVSLRPE